MERAPAGGMKDDWRSRMSLIIQCARRNHLSLHDKKTQQLKTCKRGRWSYLEMSEKTTVEETQGQGEKASAETQSTILPDDDRARSAFSQRPNDIVSIPWQSGNHGWLVNEQYRPQYKTIVHKDLIYYQGSSISQPKYLLQIDHRCGQTPPTKTFYCDCCKKAIRHAGWQVNYWGGYTHKN